MNPTCSGTDSRSTFGCFDLTPKQLILPLYQPCLSEGRGVVLSSARISAPRVQELDGAGPEQPEIGETFAAALVPAAEPAAAGCPGGAASGAPESVEGPSGAQKAHCDLPTR